MKKAISFALIGIVFLLAGCAQQVNTNKDGDILLTATECVATGGEIVLDPGDGSVSAKNNCPDWDSGEGKYVGDIVNSGIEGGICCKANSDNEVGSCKSKGGKILKDGNGTERCILPTADAGKPCTNNSECEVFCVVENESDTQGTCYPESFSGCALVLNNGKVAQVCE